ncbi:ABC transporter permease [Bradyrhizobium sp. CCBAU 53340]|uniref:ABC transporter permease n=1 Tax=Bradyrhizobium sp. CCBAU 53340 TaxID=1325112 RepID=UPI00188D351D|nr:ABC transporter permease [Bradyrhizobium sp. CCBAU 53340]QOZ43990.1 ABC transporter permease [Bradyrhizobium sp. CCBAU 53340]
MEIQSSTKPPPANLRLAGKRSAFQALWGNRHLIRRLAGRELQSRYRGNILGIAWAVLVPLGMVLMYSLVFGSIFKARWSGIGGSSESMTAFFLAGVIVHQFLGESVSRAPSLVLDNKNYVTRVVFPLEVLPVVTVTVALVGASIALVLLAFLTALTSGIPPITVLLSPLALLGMIPMLLGLTWILAAIGVFVRDLSQILPIALSVLFFLAPVLYPRSSVPEPFGSFVVFNPITIPIETMRALVFGHPFPWESAAIYLAVSLVICWLGLALFSRLRRAFADVL